VKRTWQTQANPATNAQTAFPHPKMSCKETAYLTGRSSIEGYETRHVAFGFPSCNQQSNTVTVSYIVNFIDVITISVEHFCYVNRVAHTEFNMEIRKNIGFREGILN
jgi:hypothetical protein